jgi:hypothetical protein
MQRNDLKKDLEKVLLQFPKLAVDNSNEKTCLRGEIDIFDKEGTYWDSYFIKIVVPIGYPYAFPELFETSNKFPHVEDRHANIEGNCCLCSLQEEDIISQKGISMCDFIHRYVIPFLANQIYYDLIGTWANGEYKHGYDGILQYYQELLEMADLKKVYDLITLLKTNTFQRNDNCYCGENKKIKYCHLKQYSTFKSISLKRVNKDLDVIKLLLDMERSNFK